MSQPENTNPSDAIEPVEAPAVPEAERTPVPPEAAPAYAQPVPAAPARAGINPIKAPIAAMVAAATFIVGGGAGFLIGHSSSDSSSQAGPQGQFPGGGQFQGSPGGTTGSGTTGEGFSGQPPMPQQNGSGTTGTS